MAETAVSRQELRQRRLYLSRSRHPVSIFVVDARVVIKWFVPEVHSDAARRLLLQPHQYIAPDLLFAEIANTIWKKTRRGELTASRGQQLVEDIARAAVEAVPCRDLVE